LAALTGWYSVSPISNETKSRKGHLKRKQAAIYFLVGLGVLFFSITIGVAPPAGLPANTWGTLGAFILLASLWVTEIIPFAITALLPVVIFPIFQIRSLSATAASYANPVVFLFLGGMFMALAMQRWHLQRRIALFIIQIAGTSRVRLVAGFLAASAFLSMWVSNTAVAVMMIPIGVAALSLFRREEGFDSALLLSIAYGSSIGGMATLVGTPPNVILAGFLMDQHKINIGFLGWVEMALPVCGMLLLAAWFILTRVACRLHGDVECHSPDALKKKWQTLGRPSAAEWRVGGVFILTAVLWILRPVIQRWIPLLSDAAIGLAGGIALFVIPAGDNKSRLLDWRTARRFPIDILILIGGGLALAAAIEENGMALWIAQLGARIGDWPFSLLLLSVLCLVIGLAEFTSNTATVASLLPVASALAVTLNLPPLPLTIAVGLGGSCGFMLPVSTPPNTIVYGTGRVPLSFKVRTGFLMNLAACAILWVWLAWLAPYQNLGD